MAQHQETQNRKRGRPTKQEVAEREARENRPNRIPITGHRDILTVENKDPNFVYRWVRDISESGRRILQYKRAFWDFCRTDEDLVVGEDSVYRTTEFGGIYRIPDGTTPGASESYLYLMKLPRHYYEDDLKRNREDIMSLEQDRLDPDEAEGQYGRNKLDIGPEPFN